MELSIIIKNLIIIGAILAVVFLSQQPYFVATGKDLYVKGVEQGNDYWQKGEAWAEVYLWPKVGGGVGGIQTAALEQVNDQKNNFAQYTWKKFKEYFAGKFSKTFGTEVK